MKIRSILLVLLACISLKAAAQSTLHVQGISPNLYLVHTVVAKDNWYSIGRMYNMSPKELAPFNNADMEKPLEIGQEIRIPLKPSNFSQDNQKEADEVFVPVYYVVKEREWMYRISQNNNKVPIEKLEQWNNVSNGDVKPGLDLIVGYLKVKSSQSPLASQSASVRTAPPVAKTTTQTTKSSEPAVDTKVEEKSLDHPKEKAADVAKVELPAAAAQNKIEDKPVVDKQESKPLESKPVETKPVITQTTTDNRGGYFKTQYDETGKGANGAAGVFRSTSGWQDGKYYALMNNIPVGTIIKVANPSNGKTVYAKVLGNLPDMKESAGLTLRISDAAATELGLASNKFPVSVRY